MKKIIFLLLLTATSLTAQAQTSSTESKARILQECRRLYSEKEYPTALTMLSRLDISSLSHLEQQEVDYLRATSVFRTNKLEGRALMLRYIEKYPESANNHTLAAYIAETYYFAKNFEQACARYSQCDFDRLAEEDRENAELYYALSLQECGDSDKCRTILNKLKTTGKHHRNDAVFHLASIEYHRNNLQQAYEGFKSIELDDTYYLEVPYYIAGIYLKNKEYIRAQKVAELFINDHAQKRQGKAMQQILGASYFGQGKYEEAIPCLEQYINEYDTPQRISYYQLGICYLETERYSEALTMLSKCIDENDAIAQNSYLQSGITYLKLNDMAQARQAFEQASTMEHDDAVRQEALYNYALCIHQTRYSPFAESVKVFEQFLNEYPNSSYSPQVSKYLVEVYMNTRNYDIALESIEKIQNPSNEILGAKQNILYRLGVQAIIDNRLPAAIEYMNRSLALSRYSAETHSDALYWRGESYYRMNNWTGAANDYRAVLSLSPRNAEGALYGLAYTQFQQGNYQEAENTFTRFLQQCRDNHSMRADAYNRIGDCHFYNRDYTTAQNYYEKASAADKQHSDYSLYRTAVTQGLQKDYPGKVKTLQKLISQYPASNYAEQAYYEMGRSYVAQEKSQEAINTFDELIKKYPNSGLSRRAAAEKAMIYNQDGNTAKAIAAYKQIIQNYPQSEEAQVAAQDLKNIYVEEGKVDEYAAFAASTPHMKAIESSERDTLTYIAAEKIYGKRNYNDALGAFQRYLEEFPKGAFTLDSHYYTGLIYNNKKSYAEALSHFEKVIAYPNNKYSEEAMALASEIHYNNKRYDEAYELYNKLVQITNNEERKQACRMNSMRCAYLLDKFEESAATAGMLLTAGGLSPEWEREALYTRAKSLLNTNKKQEAIKDLEILSGDTRSIQGAESKYLLAQYYYQNNEYEKCEKEILHYIDTSTPHAYWLARSFVLLADLYTKQGREIEAKQYLLSLQNNYNEDDDIKTLIKERLDKLTNKTN